ncbi:MAG TPA: glycosyltransferase family 2 protein [Acidimicrobiales bacterium]|nr:glycosyltransferase family 2 protein [Acidimicrobiales bacterium]
MSVIVVTHQSAAEIAACLSSLREHGGSRVDEVIVVDNASTDGTCDLVSRDHPEVRLVRGTKRQGFAANCNTGARLATGNTLFLLNPDGRVRPGAIDLLVERLDSDDSIGIVGPRLVYPDGSLQPSARRFPTVGATVIRRTPLRWLLRSSRHESRHLMLDRPGVHTATEPYRVDWLLGAALAISSDLYTRLGGMDEGYRLYCEDIDLCWRTWEAGLEVVQVPEAVVEHDLSELTRHRFLTRATAWHFRSMARFALRHGLRPPTLPPAVAEKPADRAAAVLSGSLRLGG